MKNSFFLRVKNLDIQTGNPWIVVIHRVDAQRYGLRAGDELNIHWQKKQREAMVDITETLVKLGQVGLFHEVINEYKIKKGQLLELSLAGRPISMKAIQKKLLGKPLSYQEIYSIISDIVNNRLNDVEIGFFVASALAKKNNFSHQEMYYMVKAMANTGARFNFGRVVADKHSIGGLPGNRVTPIIVAIVASYGVIIPKTSTRAVTSAAGTADTFEVLTSVSYNSEQIKKIVKKVGACLMWGANDVAPADDKILGIVYQLGMELYTKMVISIVAKKVAMGITHLILDIPVGPTAKVTTLKDAKIISQLFQFLTKKFHIKTKILIQKSAVGPVGKGIGPSLEARDILRVLQQKENRPIDLEQKSLLLAGTLLELVGRVKKGTGIYMARRALINGQAWKKMKEIIIAQGGKPIDSEKVKIGRLHYNILAHKNGRIIEVHNKNLVEICRLLGAPKLETAGIYFHKMINEPVKNGDVLFTLYTDNHLRLNTAKNVLNKIWIYKIK